MERGFYHHERGYWQTTGDVPAEILARYPEGTIEVPLKPGAGFEWQDGVWTYLPPAVSEDAVDLERDRRIAAGFTFAGVFYQTRPEDRENIAGASTAALAAMVAGAEPGDLRWHGEDTDFAWIAADNSTHPMDAQTMFAFGQAAMAHKTRHIFAGRDLKNMDPIPLDYADNAYWP